MRQHLALATFKKPENQNQSYDAEIAVEEESVLDNVFVHSTAEELVMFNAFVEGQVGSGVGSHDEVCGLVQMKLEEPGNSEGKILLKITAGGVPESSLDNDDDDWPLGIDHMKDISLNWEPHLLDSGKKNSEVSFSYVASDEILQSKQTVQSAIKPSLRVGQIKISTEKEVFFRKISTSESHSEELHVHKIELGDDKSLTPPKASDLEMKIPIDGENAFPFDFGENVVPVHFDSSFPKQGSEREQSSDFEVKKAIGTDRNQLWVCLAGREETVKYRKEVSCRSSPSLLRGSDDQTCL